MVFDKTDPMMNEKRKSRLTFMAFLSIIYPTKIETNFEPDAPVPLGMAAGRRRGSFLHGYSRKQLCLPLFEKEFDNEIISIEDDHLPCPVL